MRAATAAKERRARLRKSFAFDSVIIKPQETKNKRDKNSFYVRKKTAFMTWGLPLSTFASSSLLYSQPGHFPGVSCEIGEEEEPATSSRLGFPLPRIAHATAGEVFLNFTERKHLDTYTLYPATTQREEEVTISHLRRVVNGLLMMLAGRRKKKEKGETNTRRRRKWKKN